MNERVSEYLRGRLAPERDPLLAEMLDFARERHIPVLLPESAAFLKTLAAILRPRRTLEIGTAIGYSAQLILRNGGERLYTVEKDEERVAAAKEYFARAGLSTRATVMQGDAEEILPLIDGEFDFIFLDGPKTAYPRMLPGLVNRLKKGGALLADDVLWSGYVTGEREMPRNKSTIVEGLASFNERACAMPELTVSILPVGEGMLLAVKGERSAQ